MKLLTLIALLAVSPALAQTAAPASDPVAVYQALLTMLSEREIQVAQLQGQIATLQGQITALTNQVKQLQTPAKPAEGKK